MEPDRGLPDALDQIEYVGAFLIPHGIAEDASEQPDIGPQPGILFQRQFFKRLGLVGAIGPEIGVGRHHLGLGRHHLGRHGQRLQKTARQPSSRNFLAAAQGQEKGDATQNDVLIQSSGGLAASHHDELAIRKAVLDSSPGFLPIGIAQPALEYLA
jgi:hypothetical protein